MAERRHKLCTPHADRDAPDERKSSPTGDRPSSSASAAAGSKAPSAKPSSSKGSRASAGPPAQAAVDDITAGWDDAVLEQKITSLKEQQKEVVTKKVGLESSMRVIEIRVVLVVAQRTSNSFFVQAKGMFIEAMHCFEHSMSPAYTHRSSTAGAAAASAWALWWEGSAPVADPRLQSESIVASCVSPSCAVIACGKNSLLTASRPALC